MSIFLILINIIKYTKIPIKIHNNNLKKTKGTILFNNLSTINNITPISREENK